LSCTPGGGTSQTSDNVVLLSSPPGSTGDKVCLLSLTACYLTSTTVHATGGYIYVYIVLRLQLTTHLLLNSVMHFREPIVHYKK